MTIRALNLLRIFFSVAALALILLGLFTMREASRSRGWAVTDGRVVSSNVSDFAARDGTHSYRPMVIFSYSVNSLRYMSNHISFRSLAASNRDAAARYAARYPANSRVRVYYDPFNPEHAVLEPAGNPWLPIVAGGLCSMLAVATRIMRGRVEKRRG